MKSPVLKNILALVIGCVAGGLVNMGIVMISGSIIPPPHGADITTMEGLRQSMHLFKPQNFLFPFLAHSVGTFVGAMLAALVAANRKMFFALVIGVFFLAGGITNILMLPSPLWFTLVDLIGAYIPVAYLAGRLVLNRGK